MLRSHWPFALGVGLQALIVSIVVARPALTLLTGTTVLLQTAPVDPYNIMSGYHVVLSYEISDTARLPGELDLRVGSPVYVVLRADADGIWRPMSATTEPVTTMDPDTVVIQGTCKQRRRIVYGIESYFVPEGKGGEIERGLRGAPGEALAEVRVDASGQGALVRLHIGDKTYDY